jgi:adenylate cyclase class IV
VHSTRELLGLLAKILEELGFGKESGRIRKLSREYRDFLVDLDSVYAMPRHGLFTYSGSDVAEMARLCEELHKLLDEVESSVLD